MAEEAWQKFPMAGILPKGETQAMDFLERFPNHDGRGVVVGILDTGVDPGAEGLQYTSDGRPKIIDIVDATGGGDVDTSKVVKAEDGVIKGLSGRTLKLGQWSNPSGEYHIGLKAAYDFFPSGLVKRIKAERRKPFDEAQRVAAAVARQKVEEWDATHSGKRSPEDVAERQDLELRLAQLDALMKNYEDAGPIYDCVVFHDGSVWRAVVDTKESGDLTNEKVLADYKIEHEYHVFSEVDMMNFSVNVYEDGNVLSIVTNAGSHGTHVAGIVAACYKNDPACNGVAPGAQIVAIKIGDSRRGSMETGTGLVRALIASIASKCDVINLSFGEDAEVDNAGFYIELAKELVYDHNIMFVASAGNNGPALSTVGTPGGTSSCILGVGAWVSPSMMSVEYSLRDELPPNLYTWSSRGPCTDGSWGVDVAAPGGAIAPVPNWTLQKNQQMNGTSMSSPNCTGSIALIMSALKANKRAYTPWTVRQALCNTARSVPNCDQFGMGCGLIQVSAAYDFLMAEENASENLVDFPRIDVVLPATHARGIYLREVRESSHPHERSVRITPVFHEDTPNSVKVAFERRIVLHSTQSWVLAPKHVVLPNSSKDFLIKVDPTSLQKGEVHYAFVIGVDASRPERGPLFRVPVTVVRPREIVPDPTVPSNDVEGRDGIHTETLRGLRFEPGKIRRVFIDPPKGATSVTFTLKAVALDTQRRIYVHSIQLHGHRSYEYGEHLKATWLRPEENVSISRSIVDGVTMELCVAQFWSSLGPCTMDVDMSFHGLSCDKKVLYIDSASRAGRLELKSAFRTEHVHLSASLDSLRKSLRPVSFSLVAAKDSRNSLSKGRQLHVLQLNYHVKLEEGATVRVLIPMLSDLLYESAFEAPLWEVLDSNKKIVATRSSHSNDTMKLEKGSYTVRFAVRHYDVSLLEPLKAAILQVKINLSKDISLATYKAASDALTTSSKFSKKTLKAGQRLPIFISGVCESSLSKDAKIGDVLCGKINLYEDTSLKNTYSVRLFCPVPPEVKSNKCSLTGAKYPPEVAQADDMDDEEKLSKLLLDKQVDFLKSLKRTAPLFSSLSESLLKSHPNHLPLLRLLLNVVDEDSNRSDHLDDIIAAADNVIAAIDKTAVAMHLGQNIDKADPAAVKRGKDLDGQKGALTDAMYKKAMALLDKIELSERDAEAESELEVCWTELKKWVNVEDMNNGMLFIRYHQQRGQLGHALKAATARLAARADLSSSDEKNLFECIRSVLAALGWDHWEKNYSCREILNFPSK